MIQALLVQPRGRAIEVGVRHICYATQNGRQSVIDLAKQLRPSLVVCPKHCMHSNGSAEIGRTLGAPEMKSKFPATLN